MWKKSLIVLLVAALVFGLAAGMAMARVTSGYEPAYGQRLPCHGEGPGAYVKMSRPFYYSCNGQYRITCTHKTGVDVPFMILASIAQWIKLDVDVTKIEWRIIKPGTYTLPYVVTFDFKSNGDVSMSPYGFSHMVGAKEAGDPGGDVIDTFYKIKQKLPSEGSWTSWIAAPDFNSYAFFIPEFQAHGWIRYEMDSKIVVEECDSACEYEDQCAEGFTFILEEQKCWIEPYLSL